MTKNRMIVLDSAEPDRFSFIDRIKAEVIFLDDTSLRSDIVLDNKGVSNIISFGSSQFKVISEKKITKFEARYNEEATKKIENFIEQNISFTDIGFYTTTSGSTGVPKIIKMRNSTNFASLKWATNPKVLITIKIIHQNRHLSFQGAEDVPKLAEKFGADLPNIMAHINNVAAFVNFVGHIMVLFLGLLMEGPHLRRNLLLCDQYDLKSSLAAIAAEKCGGVWGYTPKIIQISESQELKEIELPSVSLFIAGGAKMTAEHMRRIRANFAAAQNGRKCHVLKIYGSTEMGPQLFRFVSFFLPLSSQRF